jgi:hypothetical protein
MTGNSSAAGHETFDESLLECVEDINKLLPGLGRRYDMTVILSALAEHVGSALKALMLRKVCDARQARQVIKNIESAAFQPRAAQLKTEGPAQEADETPPPAGSSGPTESDT